jgi:hypothetical protein
MMMAVFRQLEGGVAQQLWTAAAAEGGRRLPCPFCAAPMEDKSAPTGEVARCLVCESVWLDKAAFESMPADPGPKQQPLNAQELKCPQCGAPLEGSYDEQCRYCGAALKPPVTVVIVPDEEQRPGGAARGWGGAAGGWGGGRGGWGGAVGEAARIVGDILGR